MKIVARSALLALLSLSPALAEDPAMVDAAVIGVVPEDYDGKRIRTEMSIMAPLDPQSSKGMGCKKETIGFMLGPKMSPGAAPSMMAGQWVLCAPKAEGVKLAPLKMGTPIVFDATVEVKRSMGMNKLLMSEVIVVSVGESPLP